MNRNIQFISALVLLFMFQAVFAQLQHLQGFEETSYQKFIGEKNKHNYHVFVKVPANDNNEKLPTVYLLDGGNTFPMLASYAKYLTLVEELPPMIFVGISYGTSDWQKGNKRSTDYTLPAVGRDHYGGANAFHHFLTNQLMPWVEATYSSDPKQRVLFGHSIGGQFVLYNAMFKPETFSGLIASNPAIHNNAEAFMVDLSIGQEPTKLFVLQADGDDDRYRLPRLKWLNYWQDKPHHWQQKVVTKKGHNHMSSVPDAFRYGLKWLFPKKESITNEPN